MLTMAKVSTSDLVIDLGAGDGRVVRLAARKFGARGHGVDLDDELVRRSRELARRDGVADRVSFAAQDLFVTDISRATVLTMYLLPALNLKLRSRLLSELRPGTRIVSHDFDLGAWRADETTTLFAKEKYGGSGGDSTVYLWVVPAHVAGRWQWQMRFAGQRHDVELHLQQQFQQVSGVLRVGGRDFAIRDARLHGAQLQFAATAEVAGDTLRFDFSGQAEQDAFEGVSNISGGRIHAAQQWSAKRVNRGALFTNQAAASAAPSR
jgi:SAM-dependent methyltransferase